MHVTKYKPLQGNNNHIRKQDQLQNAYKLFNLLSVKCIKQYYVNAVNG